MKLHVFLLTWLTVFAHRNGVHSSIQRLKRDATGALHILTNHAQPIHADVKSENADRSGNNEKVLAPVDTYYQKSLRKSLLEHPSKVDLVRNIGRVITLAVLLVSAVLEFFPILKSAYESIYNFLYL